MYSPLLILVEEQIWKKRPKGLTGGSGGGINVSDFTKLHNVSIYITWNVLASQETLLLAFF